ncbi:MAG: DNA recombination protein RmuC [Pseudomonadota bacterium]
MQVLIGAAATHPGVTALIAMLAALAYMAYRQQKRLGGLMRRLSEAQAHLAAQDARLEEAERLKRDLAEAQDLRVELTRANADLHARLGASEAALEETRARLDGEFKAIANSALEASHKAFLARAEETFKKYDQTAAGDAEARTKAVDAMVKPISETLARYEAGLKEMRETTAKREGEMRQRLGEVAQSTMAVRNETTRLVTALRAAPKTRGRWGEEALQNVVDLAGMTPYCQQTQKALDGASTTLMPDMVVNLPGGRKLAIDAKASLNNYLSAVEEVDEAAREALFKQHADDIRRHVEGLARKDYAAELRDSLDFVIMFIPGENFFSAAIERRPELFQQAFDKRVLLATPTTLLAILKSVAYGWRQEKAADNAKHILTLGKELYASLQTMGGNIAKLGKSIDQSTARYNDLVGNIEGRVMPKARKFTELDVEGADKPLDVLEPAGGATRALRGDRDLFLEDQTDASSAARLPAASGAGMAENSEDAA